MIIRIFVLFVSFCSSFVFSQTLIFDYDKAGNQIERKLQSTTVRSARLISALPPLGPLVEEEKISDHFTVSPSPTLGPVTLGWNEQYKGRVVNIQLVDYSTRREKVAFNPLQNKVMLDLTAKPEGVYIIIFYLDDGNSINKKILRQN